MRGPAVTRQWCAQSMTKPQSADSIVADNIERVIELYQRALLYASRGLALEAAGLQEDAEARLRTEVRVLRQRGL